LSEDENDSVRRAIAKRDDLDDDIMDKLSNDKSDSVRKIIEDKISIEQSSGESKEENKSGTNYKIDPIF
jgi:hypothetical protein